ncbi:MAG: hypothetical protein BRC34_16535 [Cyanobacteria bacterium QH_1_48_107]|nr:MAG: hypothetical protein BRC34_16535 [Cyanobacteria bacterium QH_1_48_107]
MATLRWGRGEIGKGAEGQVRSEECRFLARNASAATAHAFAPDAAMLRGDDAESGCIPEHFPAFARPASPRPFLSPSQALTPHLHLLLLLPSCLCILIRAINRNSQANRPGSEYKVQYRKVGFGIERSV